jgi:Transcription factor involved in chromatin remodeling, contains bromodomain
MIFIDRNAIFVIIFFSVEEKFEEEKYNSLRDFVCDLRLLLLNTYRFFGPDAKETKQALRIEKLLEQKLALLSE